jgi:hypothetical protein
VILVVEVVSIRVGDSVVEDELSGLGDFFSAFGNCGVEVIRNCFLGNLRNEIGRNTPALHSHNPIVK